MRVYIYEELSVFHPLSPSTDIHHQYSFWVLVVSIISDLLSPCRLYDYCLMLMERRCHLQNQTIITLWRINVKHNKKIDTIAGTIFTGGLVYTHLYTSLLSSVLNFLQLFVQLGRLMWHTHDTTNRVAIQETNASEGRCNFLFDSLA